MRITARQIAVLRNFNFDVRASDFVACYGDRLGYYLWMVYTEECFYDLMKFFGRLSADNIDLMVGLINSYANGKTDMLA